MSSNRYEPMLAKTGERAKKKAQANYNKAKKELVEFIKHRDSALYAEYNKALNEQIEHHTLQEFFTVSEINRLNEMIQSYPFRMDSVYSIKKNNMINANHFLMGRNIHNILLTPNSSLVDFWACAIAFANHNSETQNFSTPFITSQYGRISNPVNVFDSTGLERPFVNSNAVLLLSAKDFEPIIYSAPNFYIKDGKITPVNPDYQLMLGGGSVLDLKERKIKNIANNNSIISLDEKLKQGKLNLIKNPDNSRTLHINKQPVCRVLDGEICWANVSGVDSVCLNNLGHLMGDLRFCDVQQMYICSCNLKNVSGITLQNIGKLVFFANNYANGCLDFSDVQNLDLSVSNMLRNPNVVFNKSAQSIKISYVIGMVGELDFSHVDTLNISYTDLTSINKIKLNPDGQILMDAQSFNSAKNLIQQYKNIKIR